jgi:hypothetical protein
MWDAEEMEQWAHPEDDAPVEPLRFDPRRPRRYLVIHQEPGEHQILEMGKVIAELERTDIRLPSIFWSRFRAGLGHLEMWDHEEALKHEEMSGYWEDEEDDPRPSRCIPPSLRLPWIDDEKALRILREKGVVRGSWAGELLWGAFDLQEAGRGIRIGWNELTRLERDQYSQNMGRWPSVLMTIDAMEGDRWSVEHKEWDNMAHLWDTNYDALWQGGGPYDPICVWPFEVSVAGLQALYERLGVFCAVHRAANRLMDLLTVPTPGEIPLGLLLESPHLGLPANETRLLSDGELAARGLAEMSRLGNILDAETTA